MVSNRKAAKEFAKRWRNQGDEQQDTQKFWIDLLENVLGISSISMSTYVDFERKVRGRRIDVFVSDHHFLCEQKSRGIDLDKPEPRNKGFETPYQQASWYAQRLPYSERPRWVMTCNFETFRIYDLEDDRPEDTMQEFSLEELPDQTGLLSFLTSDTTSRLHKEQQLSVDAGRYVSKIYDALSHQYRHIEDDPEEQRSLNVLITRLIFLLYAEDADLLQSHQAFGDYCQGDIGMLRRKLIDLFDVVNTPIESRDEYLAPLLAAFPYINGGLFADMTITIPQMTDEIALAVVEASQDFDWREISGVIFGGVFESTLNPETRRSGGMHYTSVENIDRCLRPLFLDGLWDELHEAEGERVSARRTQALRKLHDKISIITIGDPACGSGNFLTEAYRQLRSIENRIIEDEQGDQVAGQTALSGTIENPIRVTPDQFYGIEINDFAVAVAKTALWITEEQMLRKTQELMPNCDFEFLPLKSLTQFREGNALTTEWSDVFPSGLTFLVGNPPFRGARWQSKEQKREVLAVFDGKKNSGNVDYCACWYVKAARFTQSSHTRCALVSTNSICQGEQVANVWKPLHDMGIHIDFAHTTFRWDNEATQKAHVFCVIVGFSREIVPKELFIHDTPDAPERVVRPKRINAYLKDAPDVFVWSRAHPICDVPEMGIGSQPIDDGNYLFTEEEKADFLDLESGAEGFFHPWVGSKEFLHGYMRWCLWLGDATWADLKDLPLCRKRIENVRQYRLTSKRRQTLQAAERPAHFGTEILSRNSSIIIPEVSSERRRYIPIGFIEPETFCSNKVRLIPGATTYHLGILSSQYHNAWMRVVAGRLKSDYNYSAGIVYNNFVWPDCGETSRNEVARCAERVLAARSLYDGASLADMYDPNNEFVFPDLIEAHRALDAAVEAAYGIDFAGDEEKIVTYLFGLYAKKTKGKE